MHLAHYGLISIDGTAQRPEPGADFASYQRILTNTRAIIAIKKQLDASRERLKQSRQQEQSRAVQAHANPTTNR